MSPRRTPDAERVALEVFAATRPEAQLEGCLFRGAGSGDFTAIISATEEDRGRRLSEASTYTGVTARQLVVVLEHAGFDIGTASEVAEACERSGPLGPVRVRRCPRGGAS